MQGILFDAKNTLSQPVSHQVSQNVTSGLAPLSLLPHAGR